MGSFSGTCEIVEAKDDYQTEAHEKGQRPPLLKLVSHNSLEDDINKLFETINLKPSSKGLHPSEQAGTGTPRKNALKKPVRLGVPGSPGIGFSEPVSLKQALRGLCISQASEMAAMKRLSKSTASPRISEAGKIVSLYRSVVVEAGESSGSLNDVNGRELGISLVPEEGTSNSSEKVILHQPVPKMKPSNHSANSSPRFALATEKGKLEKDIMSEIWSQTSKTELAQEQKPTASPRISEAGKIVSLYRSVVVEAGESSGSLNDVNGRELGISLVPEEGTPNSSEKVIHHQPVPKMKPSNHGANSSPRFALATEKGKLEKDLMSEIRSQTSKTELAQEQKQIAVPSLACQTSDDSILEPKTKSSNQSAHSSPLFALVTKEKGTRSALVEDEVPASTEVCCPTSELEMLQEEKDAGASSLSHHSTGSAVESSNLHASVKLGNKVSSPKLRRKGKLQTIPSSSTTMKSNKGNKSTRKAPHSVKPVLRNKPIVKKNLKQVSTSVGSSSNADKGIINSLDLSTGQLLCQRCRCTLANVGSESNKVTPASNCASVSAQVSSCNINPGANKQGFTSDICSKSRAVVEKANKSLRTREKGDFSQSSKSSLGEYSTSTSISEESNLSGSNCGNRPHMSKDLRWEAIRHVKKQSGFLGLGHFNLLKKLGSGDIGTVYLADLIGTNCLFAIKVMDNEFLARRKKMPRAQTEREILRILDHPFLPTLYAQFTSDNLSCLVMEYCPGGDLHVLRQKQPGRYFPEQAARFYVAEVLLALEYLHMLGVIYRDLKPENILVREDGHIMLTDFDLSLRCTVSPTLLKSSLTMEPPKISGPGSSCIDPFCIEPSCKVTCFSPRVLAAAAKARKTKADLAAQVRSLPQLVAEPTDARSNSFVGTHEYLAPEIIKGEGHGSAVDWWTFGVFLYELLYGRTPFKGAGNEETLANVVLQSLKFPESPLVSFQARDLIQGLLVKEPENRLGSERGAAEIKQHPFFDGLNWALIRCAIPPQLPEFYDGGIVNLASHEKARRYLEFGAAGEHLEFELF